MTLSLPPGWPSNSTRPRRTERRFPLAFALLLIVAGSVNSWAAAPPHDTEGIDQLRRAAIGPMTVSLGRSTGTVSFLRAAPGSIPIDPAARVSRRAATMAFLERHGSAFGLRQPAEELQFLRETTDSFGYSHVRYRQVYKGIPVFASDLRSHFDRAGELTRLTATTIPVLKVDPISRLDADTARAIAVAEVRRRSRRGAPSADLQAGPWELVIFRSGLLQGTSGRNHLAYRVEVLNDSRSLREFVFVDAHSGQVIDQISGINEAIDRRIYNGGLGPQFRAWSEGDALPYVGTDATGINHLIAYAEDTYNLFMTVSNGSYPSYDGSDAIMNSVINDPGILCPNATWNGVSTNYCNGVSGDDTVAHEWAHAYTQYTHDLVYQWQPGALNESYSDIFGEVVDMLNGAGTDAPATPRAADGSACSSYGNGAPATDNSYRWLSGEDDPAFGGAIRDLWRPECYGDPGKVDSVDYFCSADDGGGVHTNSGVPNHAFALAVDGGTYNGQSITGLGMTKATHIWWRAMSVYQGPAANFADHADALEASCVDLVGSNLPALSTDTASPSASGLELDAADCNELGDAIAATELRAEPVRCQFESVLEPNPPALCFGHGDLTLIESEDWESGLGLWSADTHDIAQQQTFDTPDWAVVGNLPSGRPGVAAFVANLDQGNCVNDDETGALNLDSPVIGIPQGTVVPRVTVDHWLATEAGYDGGNIKISVNGGEFVLIPSSAIDFNPYNTTLISAPDNTNPLAGEAAFSGTDEGQLNGSWGQSQISLYGLAQAGDQIQLRFDFGVDGCTGVTGWYVDDLQVYSCSAELPPSDCGNGELDPGEQCDDGNTYIGDGCSNSCQVDEGWECTLPLPAGNVLDQGFEAGTPNPAWTEASTNFGTPICDETECGLGFGSGPAEGTFWAWFGGAQVPEVGSLSQTVTIPATATTLAFQLEITACDSAADYLEVLIDDNQEFLVDGSSPLCGVFGYTPQSVDVSAYADDGTHQLEFRAETFSNNQDVSNFFVDEVSIPGTASECTSGSATLTINKVCNPGDDSGSFNLLIDGSGSTDTACGGSYGPVEVAAGNHTVSETAGSGTDLSDYTTTIGGDCSPGGNVTLALGQNKTCTITNVRKPRLTLLKTVITNNGGNAVANDFQARIDGNDVPWNTAQTLLPGNHTASESGLPGYSASAWTGDCAADGSITLAPGQDATCSITNDDIAPTLTITKTCNPVNDTGSFNLLIDGSGSTDTACGGSYGPVEVAAGNHTVSETAGSGTDLSDYTTTIGGDCSPGGNVTLALGQHKTCTITNVRKPRLTLLKTVVTNNGGNAVADDFQARIDGNDVPWNTAQTLPPGNHTASESGLPGYSASAWTGDCAADGSITLAPGQNATCSITNDDIAPTLTITKTCDPVNDTGSFNLLIDGSGSTDTACGGNYGPVEVAAGNHTVSETAGSGTDLSDYTTTIGGDCSPGGNVTLALGQHKTCTITNVRKASLTLIKTVINNSGGSAEAGDFQARIDGNNVPWEVAQVLAPGTYTASEVGLEGYSASGWTGDCTGNGSITLSPGQNATCSITNDDINPNELIFKDEFESD